MARCAVNAARETAVFLVLAVLMGLGLGFGLGYAAHPDLPQCTEDSHVTATYECVQDDMGDFHDGYWWPASSGTIPPLEIER